MKDKDIKIKQKFTVLEAQLNYNQRAVKEANKVILSNKKTIALGDRVINEANKIIISNKKTITQQDRLIGELTRKVEYLEDSEAKRSHWLDVAKRDAGYDVRESFDKVWAETLAVAKSVING